MICFLVGWSFAIYFIAIILETIAKNESILAITIPEVWIISSEKKYDAHQNIAGIDLAI